MSVSEDNKENYFPAGILYEVPTLFFDSVISLQVVTPRKEQDEYFAYAECRLFLENPHFTFLNYAVDLATKYLNTVSQLLFLLFFSFRKSTHQVHSG